MWQVIKTILLGLLDLFVLLLLIKWIFQTPSQFFKALWQSGKPSFMRLRINYKNDVPAGYEKILLVIAVLGFLVWGEQSLFY
jgi:hypothetical protein